MHVSASRQGNLNINSKVKDNKNKCNEVMVFVCFFYNMPAAEECQTDTIKAFRPLKLQQETLDKKHSGQG